MYKSKRRGQNYIYIYVNRERLRDNNMYICMCKWRTERPACDRPDMARHTTLYMCVTIVALILTHACTCMHAAWLQKPRGYNMCI